MNPFAIADFGYVSIPWEKMPLVIAALKSYGNIEFNEEYHEILQKIADILQRQYEDS